MSELKQIESLLDVLESRLWYFRQILPRLDKRRNIFGTVLQTLFGVATMSDLHNLHKTLNELEIKDKDIAHSENQVTFVRKLD